MCILRLFITVIRYFSNFILLSYNNNILILLDKYIRYHYCALLSIILLLLY